MKILLLGASGLLGRGFINKYKNDRDLKLFSIFRDDSCDKFYKSDERKSFLYEKNILKDNVVRNLLEKIKPDAVINCIGLTADSRIGIEKYSMKDINALWPKRLHSHCMELDIRFIHISTDCVFSGSKGMYTELDKTDSKTIYGKTKAEGEIYSENSIVIRTSVIGHENFIKKGLLEWFLSQKKSCKGYKNAIFSGFPTIVFSQILKDYVLNNCNLKGLYHISSKPIAKYDLLKLIASTYKKDIMINVDKGFVIDRSLDCTKFSNSTNFKSDEWHGMVEEMYRFK